MCGFIVLSSLLALGAAACSRGAGDERRAPPGPPPISQGAHPQSGGGSPGAASVALQSVRRFLGGDALDRLRSLTIEATTSRKTPAGRFDAPLRTWIVFPQEYRQEMDLPTGKVVTVLGPKGSYMTVGGGLFAMPEEERAKIATTISRHPIALLKSTSHPTFTPVSSEKGKFEGEEVELVTVAHGGTATMLLIEPTTGAIRAARYEARDQGQRAQKIEVRYSDWREVDKIRYPFQTSGIVDGSPSWQTKASSVRVDALIDAALFTQSEKRRRSK